MPSIPTLEYSGLGVKWVKHGKSKQYTLPPNTAVEICPERDYIAAPCAGPTILMLKLNVDPWNEAKGPKQFRAWFRRPAEGDPANATGTGSYAVPVDSSQPFSLVHVYSTWVNQTGDPLRAVVLHDGQETIYASLAQFIVTAFQ